MPVFTSKYPDVPVADKDIIQKIFFSEKAEQNIDRVCIVDALTGQQLTFRQLRHAMLQFGAGLQDVCKLKRGEVVALYAPNLLDYAVPLFGTLAAGCTVSPANPSYTPEELAHQLRETQAKVLITVPGNLDNALAATKLVPVSYLYVFGDKSVNGVPSYTQTLLGKRLVDPVKLGTVEEIKDTVAFLCFSSGTTGKSKGVMTTHGNIVSNIDQYLTHDKEHYRGNKDNILSVLPFFHMFGLTITLITPLYAQTPIYVLPRFELKSFCETIQRHKITFSCVVPPILLLLAKDPSIDQYDFSSLVALMSGAAPLDADLTLAVLKRIPHIKIKQGYGLTETSPATTIQPTSDIVPGSSGVILPNHMIKVVDENGKEVGVNQRGELWIKGPNIMKGYLNRPKETAECIDAEGYFHSGDVVVIDERGHVFIVDRIKELIKVKGFQVAPAELEGLLLKSPLVADCAVIGIYDREQVTEVPRAYVVLKPGVEQNEATVKALQDFVASHVVPYKQIKSVRFREAIPKSATGKILRNVLRNEVKEEEARKHIKAKL
ncbi:hypothetical protein BX666DRAFT_1951230 [Dichotomocladium elegans]|nr:hypothetical protein BX666DRAFT_1951230 [Dichotomocladium elegans]